MKFDLVKKLLDGSGIGHIAETLSAMPGTDLNTLLMGVFTKRVHSLTPSAIEDQYNRNRLVEPCAVEQRALTAADALAYQVLDTKVHGVEFSPVMPLGTNAVLGGVNQRNILNAIRNCEVLADPTTALALECARKRKVLLRKDIRSAEPVSLATSARCMRLQRFDNIPGFVPHFKIFALATAGRDVGSEQFEIETMGNHLEFHLNYIEGLKSLGCDMHQVVVQLSDVRMMRKVVAHHELNPADIGRQVQVKDSSVFNQYNLEWPREIASLKDLPSSFVTVYEVEEGILSLLSKLEFQVLRPLQKKYPWTSFSFDLDRAAGMNYYSNACFKIWGENRTQDRYPLADGGFTDWTQRILSSRKERLFTSGIGTELILANFR